MYDSKKDTLAHINKVNEKFTYLMELTKNNVINHDKSKLYGIEKETFDKVTPQLNKCEYGSQEYKNNLENMKPALIHHYEHNCHHPEHYKTPFGENGMDLCDIMEMFCDWLASCERTKDGDFIKSLEINKERFGMSDDLFNIFKTTYERRFKNVGSK